MTLAPDVLVHAECYSHLSTERGQRLLSCADPGPFCAGLPSRALPSLPPGSLADLLYSKNSSGSACL